MPRSLPLRLYPILFTLVLALAPSASSAAPLILNEYNAVSAGNFLNGGDVAMDSDGGMAADSTLGRVLGNGGDWFELVVIEDGLDLRGFQLEIYDDGAAMPDAVLIVSQDALFTSLRAGTILTIAEDQPTDASYDPDGGDWWIQLQSTAGGDNTYITQSAFAVSNNDWQIRVRDSMSLLVFGPGGEGVSPSGGVGSSEVFRLEEDPSFVIDPTSQCYDDGSRASSFGQPNSWSDPAKTQRFDALRQGLPPTSQCDDTDISDEAFDPDRLIEVQISMDPADWDSVRTQTRSLLETFGGNCGERPPPSPFFFLPGDVTIDGVTIENVGIRKKGFFGSLDRLKPSLKIDLTEFVPDQRWSSLERLTLNNSRQDKSLVDQCLGYQLFRDAGLPASRCNFAHVTVNGDDLGIYVNVESIKDDFLVRNFGNAAGNLYEGTISDFRDQYIGTFEPKNGGDGSDLAAFRQAMEVADEELLAALAPFIDVDTFLTFWAMEGLVGHWDGYSGNSNNFWIYDDPATGWQFVPWSLDDIFGRGNPFADQGADLQIAPSVADRSTLVHRLWGLPAIQAAYEARINELLDDVWDETALLAEIDRMQALIEPVAGDLSEKLDETRTWIGDRASHIADDFGGAPPGNLGNPLGGRACLEPMATLHTEFSSVWDNLASTNPIAVGDVPLFTVVGLDPPFVPDAVGLVTGFSDVSGTDFPTLRFVTANFAGPTVFAFNMEVDPEQYVVGGPTAIDDSIAGQIAFIQDPLGSATVIPIGQAVDITLTLTAASTTPGGDVAGVLDATLAYWVAAPVPEPSAGLLAACALACVAMLRGRPRRSD